MFPFLFLAFFDLESYYSIFLAIYLRYHIVFHNLVATTQTATCIRDLFNIINQFLSSLSWKCKDLKTVLLHLLPSDLNATVVHFNAIDIFNPKAQSIFTVGNYVVFSTEVPFSLLSIPSCDSNLPPDIIFLQPKTNAKHPSVFS